MEKPVKYRAKSVRPLRFSNKKSSKKGSTPLELLWGAADLTGDEEAAWERDLSGSEDPERRSNDEALGFLPPVGGWVDD